jgi:hypothetical protein
LRGTNKLQNLRNDLTDDIKKIQSFGISVRGALIVGFDEDTKDIFDQQFQFIQKTNITVPSVRVLMAPPGTRLWKRVKKEGRLLKTETEGRYFGNPGTTNVIPKKMSRLELHMGYLQLIGKVYDWQNFALRMKGFISNIKRKPQVKKMWRQWLRYFQFSYLLFSGFDNKTRVIILDILKFTLKYAPYMLPRVMAIIFRQYGYAYRPALKAAIRNQIELEKSEGVKLEIHLDESLISDNFRNNFDKLFLDTYQQVYSGLQDKSRVEETLIEIFMKFLENREDNHDSLSQYQLDNLRDLIEKQILEKNNSHQVPSLSCAGDTEMPMDLKKYRLAEGILKAVEQQMLINAQ